MIIDRRTSAKVTLGWVVLVLLATVAHAGKASQQMTSGTDLPQQLEPDRDSVGRTSPVLRPVIQNLSARVYGGYLIVGGNVANLTGSPTEWKVLLGGSILGATMVQTDGSFRYGTDYSYTYGEVTALAVGPNGVESARATIEIHP